MRDLWDRFWEKVDRSGDCWAWTGSTDKNGYGQVYDHSIKNRRTASRVAWELTRGAIPSKVSVLHRCDNPSCVRPTHLFVGDQRANMQDAAQKGRLPPKLHRTKGNTHPLTKIREEDLEALRARYAAGEKRKDLALEYGVSYKTIWSICTGKERT